MSKGRTIPTPNAPRADTIDLESLNGAQIRLVVAAICDSFDEDTFDLLLQTRLDRKLTDLAERGTFPAMVLAVVRQSQNQGFGGQLIAAIEAERPNAERIQDLRLQLARIQTRADQSYRPQIWNPNASGTRVVAAILVSVIVGVAVYFIMHPDPPDPDNGGTASVEYTICIGDPASGCPDGSEHYRCGNDLTKIAAEKCIALKYQIQQSPPQNGGECRYVVGKITCVAKL